MTDTLKTVIVDALHASSKDRWWGRHPGGVTGYEAEAPATFTRHDKGDPFYTPSGLPSPNWTKVAERENDGVVWSGDDNGEASLHIDLDRLATAVRDHFFGDRAKVRAAILAGLQQSRHPDLTAVIQAGFEATGFDPEDHVFDDDLFIDAVIEGLAGKAST
ncbi:MAG: hypothetical protein ACT6QM_05940 [Brevundimonas mediterranea]|uniref:hypothetical protein n=1 Tax=Brevundimonas mediterranea TaxID=74329 RepID=UPI0040345EF2